MSAGWVGGGVRARALAARRLGAGHARDLASSPSLADGLRLLADGPYGHDVRSGQTIGQAQRGLSCTLLWHLRVLAGWLPGGGVDTVRRLAGWFEATNVCWHARALAGHAAERPYDLGALSMAWPRVAAATSPPGLRDALARSVWGDPGADAPSAVAVGVRLSWALRVSRRVRAAAPWASGGAALLVARERFLLDRPLTAPADDRAAAVLGRAAAEAGDLGGFAQALSSSARWALDGVAEPGDLWRAEARWWDRVERDGFELLGRAGFGPDPVVGAVAVLAADARRCQAALECAARGGRPLEVFDALA